MAFLPILGIASAYARLNRSEPNMGSGYMWVGRSLGPWPGFITGWVTLIGTVIFMAYTSAVTGSVFLQFRNKAGWHHALGLTLDPNSTALSTVVGLLVLAVVTYTAITGVRKAHPAPDLAAGLRVRGPAGLLRLGPDLGGHAFQWSWLNPFAIRDGTAFAQGLVLAVFFFWGWDAAFSVTEETKNVRDAARGGLHRAVHDARDVPLRSRGLPARDEPAASSSPRARRASRIWARNWPTSRGRRCRCSR